MEDIVANCFVCKEHKGVDKWYEGALEMSEESLKY